MFINHLIDNELDELLLKYEALNKEEKEELAEIFGNKVDIQGIVDDDLDARMAMSDYNSVQKGKLMRDLIAFMDAHPVNVN